MQNINLHHKMSSLDDNKVLSDGRIAAKEDIKLSRYDVYSDISGSSKMEKDNLKTPSLHTNVFAEDLKLLKVRKKHEREITLYVKETQTEKDCGSLNPVLTATQRPKSALNDPGNSYSLFGVSLSQPLMYSRNALAVKGAVDKRRSSCSDLSPKNVRSGKE